MRPILRRALLALAAATLLPAAALAEDLEVAGLWEDYGEGAAPLELQTDDASLTCGASCSRCRAGCYAGCRDGSRLLDNTYFFFAGDGWANQPDDDDANNFGFRTGLNSGVPLARDQGIGMQIGTSVGFYDLLGREDGDVLALEDQIMLTAGVFKRGNVCCGDPLSWAVVYDHQFHNDFAEDGTDYVSLGQLRALAGYALSRRNEIGVWMTQTVGDRDSLPGFSAVVVTEPVNQYNGYWRRHWQYGGDTMLYFGTAEDPGEFVAGLNGRLPLNPCWAFFGGVHYIKPSAGAGNPQFEEEVWNVTCGLVFYPGANARARSVSGNRWLPLLPVADNGTFALEQDP